MKSNLVIVIVGIALNVGLSMGQYGGGGPPNYQQNRPTPSFPQQYYPQVPQYNGGGRFPQYGGNPPSYGGNPPSYGGNQPSYGGNQPSYGGNQPSYGGNQPSYGGNPPSYGGNPPSYGGNPPSYGGNYGRPPYGGGRPGGNQPPAGGGDPVPCFCTADYSPVCGTDRVTYSNSCTLECARVRNPNIGILHQGECQ